MDDHDLTDLLAGVDDDLDDVLQRTQAETDEFLRDFTKAEAKKSPSETRRQAHLRMGLLLRQAGEAYFLRRGRKPPYAA